MNKMKIASYIILIVSVLAILYALMSKPIKEEEEERREEPFTGY